MEDMRLKMKDLLHGNYLLFLSLSIWNAHVSSIMLELSLKDKDLRALHLQKEKEREGRILLENLIRTKVHYFFLLHSHSSKADLFRIGCTDWRFNARPCVCEGWDSTETGKSPKANRLRKISSRPNAGKYLATLFCVVFLAFFTLLFFFCRKSILGG